MIKYFAVVLLFPLSVYADSCGGGSLQEKCACINSKLENIKQQQRNKSTQQLRNDYKFWSDVKYSECKQDQNISVIN